jgi:murein DD-endopeptidase MepM/ murein hydrolase activator NlpD
MQKASTTRTLKRVLPVNRRRRPRRCHAGVDLGRPGDVVRAPEEGRVIIVGRASFWTDEPRWSQPRGWDGYGPNFIVIHGLSGRYHLLAHIIPIVDPRIRVWPGAFIGVMATAVGHMHWEVRTELQPCSSATATEITLDPIRWLAGQDVTWGPSLDHRVAMGGQR